MRKNVFPGVIILAILVLSVIWQVKNDNATKAKIAARVLEIQQEVAMSEANSAKTPVDKSTLFVSPVVSLLSSEN